MNKTEIKEEQTIYMDLYEKLKSMKFSGMAEELRLQLENPNSDLESFQDRFEKLVTAEWNLRYNKKFERYLKKAKLKIPGATFDEKLYDPDRQLDIPTIEKLNTCTWIDEGRNLVVTGMTGTGKTYLAMAMAITAFKRNEVNRIILTRPAIEAGEKLGFLPGDLQSKIDPYLRPLYDALYQIMGAESFLKNSEKGLIEVAPLAYMRGRTLDNAFIILDEAQNTTPAQMKMFLTRIGFGSKVVITGDSTQKDLPSGTISGLDVAVKVVKDLEGINICTLTSKDVVRHPLVQKIVKAYEDYEKKSSRPRENRRKKQ